MNSFLTLKEKVLMLESNDPKLFNIHVGPLWLFDVSNVISYNIINHIRTHTHTISCKGPVDASVLYFSSLTWSLVAQYCITRRAEENITFIHVYTDHSVSFRWRSLFIFWRNSHERKDPNYLFPFLEILHIYEKQF